MTALPVMQSAEMQKQKSKAKREALDAAGIKTPVQAAHEAAKQDEQDEVQKGAAEGSRGGHVIGHTSSGKPIYARTDYQHTSVYPTHTSKNTNMESDEAWDRFTDQHKDWSAKDLVDAAGVHSQVAADIHAKDPRYQQRWPDVVPHVGPITDDEEHHRKVARRYKQEAEVRERGFWKSNDLPTWLDENDSTFQKSMKPQDGPEKNVMDLCKCGASMKKGADGKCSACGKLMKAETTGVSSDFGSNPESTDKRAVVEIEKAGPGSRGGQVLGRTASGKPIYASHSHPAHAAFTPQDHADAVDAHSTAIKKIEDTPPKDMQHSRELISQMASHAQESDKHTESAYGPRPGKLAKAIPGADAPDPEEKRLDDDGDAEGNPVNTSDAAAVQASNAMLKKGKGLKSWLTKAGEMDGDGDEDDNGVDDDDEKKPDAEEGDDLEKSRYVRRTGSPGNYRYEYAHAHPGEHKDKQDLASDDGKNAKGLRGAIEAKHKLMQKWASGEHGDVPDLKTTEMKPNPHLEAADKAEAAGDKDLAAAHHVVGKEMHDDRKRAEGDWERGEQVGNPQFTAHNDALKRLGHEAHESDPTQGKWGKTSEHLGAAIAKVKSSGFSSPKFDAMASHHEKASAPKAKATPEEAKAKSEAANAASQKVNEASKAKKGPDGKVTPGASDLVMHYHEADAAGAHYRAAKAQREAGNEAQARQHDALETHHRNRMEHYRQRASGPVQKSQGRNDMNAFQKDGLTAWMKSNIPGAEDTSGGTDPADDLPKGDPAEDLQPGMKVNGPMLSLAGMGKDSTSQGGSNTLASTTGAANPGDTDKLSEDDPAFGEMASGAPGLVSKTPESGNIGQGNGSLSKSQGFIPDAADLRDQQNRARILAARGRGPADLAGVGVGRAAPAQQRPAQPAASVVRKGQVVYSDASDLAVEQLMKSEGAGALDFVSNSGPLVKSEQCGACGSSKPVWLSTCPECGSVPRSAQMAKSQIPQGRLRLRVERDLHLPEGTKKG